MKLNLFVTALISAAFSHGASAFYLAEEEYDALSQIDVHTDLDADLDADIDADLDADLDADAPPEWLFTNQYRDYLKHKKKNEKNKNKKRETGASLAGKFVAGPPRPAAKTANIINNLPPKEPTAASTVAAAIAKGPPKTAAKTADIINKLPPKEPTSASTVAAAIAKGPPKPTSAAQINGETTEGEGSF